MAGYGMNFNFAVTLHWGSSGTIAHVSRRAADKFLWWLSLFIFILLHQTPVKNLLTSATQRDPWQNPLLARHHSYILSLFMLFYSILDYYSVLMQGSRMSSEIYRFVSRDATPEVTIWLCFQLCQVSVMSTRVVYFMKVFAKITTTVCY